jgi:hypothetical protein
MTGKARLNRTGILKLIGSALLVQHRVSGRSPLPRSLTRSGTGPDLERLLCPGQRRTRAPGSASTR